MHQTMKEILVFTIVCQKSVICRVVVLIGHGTILQKYTELQPGVCGVHTGNYQVFYLIQELLKMKT